MLRIGTQKAIQAIEQPTDTGEADEGEPVVPAVQIHHGEVPKNSTPSAVPQSRNRARNPLSLGRWWMT